MLLLNRLCYIAYKQAHMVPLSKCQRGKCKGRGKVTPGDFLPVRVDGALVPLNAWGRVADGHALKDTGVIGWHLDFADPWRSCWGRQINREHYDQRKSTFPVF